MPAITAEPTLRTGISPLEATLPDPSHCDGLTSSFATMLASACDTAALPARENAAEPAPTSPAITGPIFLALAAGQNIAPGITVPPATDPQVPTAHPTMPNATPDQPAPAKIPPDASTPADLVPPIAPAEPEPVTDSKVQAGAPDSSVLHSVASPAPGKPATKAAAAPAKPEAPEAQPTDRPAPLPAPDFLAPLALVIPLPPAPALPPSAPTGTEIDVSGHAPAAPRVEPSPAAETKPVDTFDQGPGAAPTLALSHRDLPPDPAIQAMPPAPYAAPAPTHASNHVIYASAGAAPPPGLASQLGSAFVVLTREGEGQHHLTMTLQPPDLGLLRISIEQAKDSPTKIAITAANPSTLLILLRDQTSLNQALDSAGIGAEGRALTFHLAAANDPLPAVPPANSTDGPRSFVFQFSGQTEPGPDGRERPQPRGQQTPSTSLNDIFPTDAAPTLRVSRPAQSGIDITA